MLYLHILLLLFNTEILQLGEIFPCERQEPFYPT